MRGMLSQRLLVLVAAVAAFGPEASAAPVVEPWPVDGPDDSAAVAAAAVGGRYAVADTFEDSVEVRDVRTALTRTIERSEIESLLPWMDLDGSEDGPCGLALSDSGRLLFVLVQDEAAAGDGQGSDAVLRLDTYTGELTLFARTELHGAGGWPHLSAAFYEGRLYVGRSDGVVLIYRAQRNDTVGVPLGARALPNGGPVRGLAIDRDSGMLFAASGTTVYRADTSQPTLTFTVVGSTTGVLALTHSSHYGGPGQGGLYVLREVGGSAWTIEHVPQLQADGTLPFAPSIYWTGQTRRHDLAATACGRMLIGSDEDAELLRDDSDSRLDFEAWVIDEFRQVVAFSKGLVSPDGEPDGWVIDTDVAAGGVRFHPASPDGACWAMVAVMLNDRLFGDPEAQSMVRTVLKRYAGQIPDGFAPGISGDGHIRHWCDPFSQTGEAKPGWPTEWASLSTQHIVWLAARARQAYPGDAQIRRASAKIIERVQGWDSYIMPGTDGLAFVSLGNGPNTGLVGLPFMEGMVFVEQAAEYGGASAQAALGRWLDRSRWPTANFVAGQPITGAVQGGFQSAFLTLYPAFAVRAFRDDPAWQEQVRHVAASHAAWTDDHSPRYFTVFSAGTTKPEWGGYNADDLGFHPGDITTFPSLMGLAGRGETSEAVGAYHAYRLGARQNFEGGASILYRRSDVDPAFSPNTAGLPDVGPGAAGLAELIQPGVVDELLALPYPDLEVCQGDTNTTGSTSGVPDGVTNLSDLQYFLTLWQGEHLDADVNTTGTQNGEPDGDVNLSDLQHFLTSWLNGTMQCP